MRRAIRSKLIEILPEVNGRVYEPHMAGPDIEKPYAVVKMGVEAGTGVRNTFTKTVTVWLYVDRTTFKDLDVLVNKTRNGLMNTDIVTENGFKFELRYIGPVGEDYYDPEWQVLGQGLRFEVPVIYE